MRIATFLNAAPQRSPWTTAETPLAEAARLMAATGLGAIPVLDRDGRLAGMVAERDILRIVAERRNGIRGLAVEEAMTRDVFTVPPEAPVDAALTAMARGAFRHMPVCDADGRLLGLVGMADLLRARLPADAAAG